MISQPIEVRSSGKNTIWVRYADGTEGMVDLSHLLKNKNFTLLANPDFFSGVYIDPETKAIAWNSNLEICPDNLYLKIRGLSLTVAMAE